MAESQGNESRADRGSQGSESGAPLLVGVARKIGSVLGAVAASTERVTKKAGSALKNNRKIASRRKSRGRARATGSKSLGRRISLSQKRRPTRAASSTRRSAGAVSSKRVSKRTRSRGRGSATRRVR